jgi:hypothetical protein
MRAIVTAQAQTTQPTEGGFLFFARPSYQRFSDPPGVTNPSKSSSSEGPVIPGDVRTLVRSPADILWTGVAPRGMLMRIGW